MFDLVTDGLSKILARGQDAGVLQGVGNGNNTDFWHDQWAQDRAFNILFPDLFMIFYEQKIPVNQVLQARS